MDKVAKLYENYEVINAAGDKATEHQKEFLEIIAAVKGESNEKKLASQFIVKFFKHFPTLFDQSIEALLDLCEDEDINIRKQAIKDLPLLCKDNKEQVGKIADILTQLLQAEETSELNIVYNSLTTLFKQDAKSTLAGMFQQITVGDVEIVRERAIKFLATKVRVLPEEVMTKEVEEYLVMETRKVLVDVNAAEFILFMSILSSLKVSKTVTGHQRLVDIAVEQAELDKDFVATDQDIVDKLIHCIRQTVTIYGRAVQSTRFVNFICGKVLPKLGDIATREATDPRLELLKLLADIVPHSAQLEEHETKVQNVFERLIEYMPLPPPEEESPESSTNIPKLEFTHVECLIYVFHQLARKTPEFLTADKNAELLKDFKLRLQYFARVGQAYIKVLREQLKGKGQADLKSEENTIKAAALRTTNNINVLIRDLFHSPPIYKSPIGLSWKAAVSSPAMASTDTPRTPAANSAAARPEENGSSGKKRHAAITFGMGSNVENDVKEKKPRGMRADKVERMASGGKGRLPLYTPPSGKYSTGVKEFSDWNGSSGRGASRGRGGFRGARPSWRY